MSLRGPEGWVLRRWLAWQPWFARHPFLVDGVVALVAGGSILASSSLAAAAASADVPAGLAFALVIVAAAALVVRRLWPLAAFAVTQAAVVTYLAVGFALGPIIQLAGFALYTVAAWRPPRLSVPACLVALVSAVPTLRHDPAGPLALLLIGGWLGLPWLLGVAVRAYRRMRDEIIGIGRRQAVYEERLAIAKEVHDVVGHGLSVINMQAGVALHVLSAQPGEVEASLRAIRSASGQALRELRATLSAYRDGGAAETPCGLDDVPALADSVRAAGFEVSLSVRGGRGAVPATVDLAGYRVVQEALTNVVRHSHARRAEIVIEYGADQVRLSVTDDGTAAGDGAVPQGRGLTGMRERARALGGTMEAGRASRGGFEVVATLPLRGGRP